MSSTARFALACALLLGAVPASAKVLARVDGVEITDQDLKIAADDLGAGLPPQLEGAARDTYLLEYLIDTKIVSRAADKQKLGEDADFARAMTYYRDKTLMERLMAKTATAASTEDQMRKVYDEAAKAQKAEQEVHALHILVPTEEEAKAALARVKGGEDFTKVATEISKDPGSPGGDLGFFTKDRMVPEFADAAFAAEAGTIVGPVKTQFGWHVIKVEEKRNKPFPSFEQVKDQVARYVAQKSQAEMIMKLRDGVKVERMDTPPADPVAPVVTPKP